jgi:hypothetical protein
MSVHSAKSSQENKSYITWTAVNEKEKEKAPDCHTREQKHSSVHFHPPSGRSRPPPQQILKSKKNYKQFS